MTIHFATSNTDGNREFDNGQSISKRAKCSPYGALSNGRMGCTEKQFIVVSDRAKVTCIRCIKKLA